MNKEILEKVDEIIDEIEKSEDYQKYLLLQKEIDNNSYLKKLINEVKVLQKDVVHKVKPKKDLDDKLLELNNYPLYLEYLNTIMDINNTYGVIENSLNNYFGEKMN